MNHRSFITAALLGLVVTGCRPCDSLVGWQSADAPVVPIRNMYNQPRVQPQAHSEFYADGRSMRPQVEGTVAREMEPDLSIQAGRTADNADWLESVPDEVVARMGGFPATLERGQARYDIYCAPCHGQAGKGDGMVARRNEALVAQNRSATFAPSDLHDERLRHIPDGQLYATITNGIRTMPAYKHSVPLDDRWAIVAYVRALQLSQASRGGAANPEQTP